MGYAVGSKCFETAVEAADHYYSVVPPLIISSTSYSQYIKTGSTWYLNNYVKSGSSMVLSYSSPASLSVFPNCSNSQNAIDGIALGWLTITPAILLWCVLYLRKAFFT